MIWRHWACVQQLHQEQLLHFIKSCRKIFGKEKIFTQLHFSLSLSLGSLYYRAHSHEWNLSSMTAYHWLLGHTLADLGVVEAECPPWFMSPCHWAMETRRILCCCYHSWCELHWSYMLSCSVSVTDWPVWRHPACAPCQLASSLLLLASNNPSPHMPTISVREEYFLRTRHAILNTEHVFPKHRTSIKQCKL